MPRFFRNLSIQQKLVASMVACLAVFVLISSGLTIRLSGDAMRERYVREFRPERLAGRYITFLQHFLQR